MTQLAATAPIGVFDSGIGGLSVLRALMATLPHENFVYVADTGNAPYGERGDAFVAQRTHAITHYLRTHHHIKALVVACNTATAAAIHEVRTHHPDLPLVGIEPALKPAAASSKTKRIAVIGTRGTLSSDKFARLQASVQDQAIFQIQACDGLAHAIERSVAPEAPTDGTSTTDIDRLCERYLGPMAPWGNTVGATDTLVLGCTHYIFALDALRALTGPHVQILETGEPVARQTQRLLEKAMLLHPDRSMPTRTLLFTTGPLPLLQTAAQRWLQLPAKNCRTVNIPDEATPP